MLNRAWKAFNAEARAPDLEKAAEYGAMGGKAKGINAHRRRLAKSKARVFWEDWETYSEEEALELMQGWKRETAYAKIGPRGAPLGRRPKN